MPESWLDKLSREQRQELAGSDAFRLVPPLDTDDIACGACHDRAVRAADELHQILAHHGLRADIRVTADEALADQCISRIDRIAQAAAKLLGRKTS